MAIFIDAEVTPDALTAFVRELPAPDELAFFNAIGARLVDDHKVDFSELVQTNRVASFRTWDGNFPTLGRDSASSSEATLMPLGVQAFSSQYSVDTARVLAFTSLSMIPALVFFSIFERRIVGGLTGAVKG